MSHDHSPMTVNTHIPESLVTGFEGALLRKVMQSSSPEPGMLYFFSEEGENGFAEFKEGEIGHFITMAEASGTWIAEVLLPRLREAEAEGGFEVELSPAPERGRSVDAVDLIAAIVDANPDELPSVEIQFAWVSSKVSPGAVGGGAVFVSPGRVEQVNSHDWLAERRAALGAAAAPRI